MDPIGRTLGGRYRIVRGIGAGGMGGVYEAVQEGLGRRVAVKIIAEQLASEEAYLERFRREAMATAQLDHPNLVQVTDFTHLPGEPPLLVMELLDGEPLGSRLRREGAQAPAFAIDVTLQILAGLEVAHAQGIVHRDLKPANVFLAPLPAGRVLVKVLDFGVAKLMDSATYHRLTQTGVLVGTPRYAAPEQIRDGKGVDHRADVYAAGGLLYCMLAGRPPFRAKGAQLLVDIQEREPTDPRVKAPALDPGLVEVLRRGMHRDRDQRFGSARAFAEALAPFAAGASRERPADTPTAVPGTQPMATPSPSHDAPTSATAPAKRAAMPPPSRRARTELYVPPSPAIAPTSSRATAPRIAPTTPVQPPPSSVAPRSRRRAGLWLGVAAGVSVGLLAAAAAGAGIWHWLLRPARGATSASASGGTGEVPAACLEWEEVACQCPSSEVFRAEYCPAARERLAMIRAGAGSSEDCSQQARVLRQLCPNDDPSPTPNTERPPTGIEECDAMIHYACTCGLPGAQRDARCRRANRVGTEESIYASTEHSERCQQELARIRRDCPPP